jgi:flagellar biosynthesis/type III secretory pathway protein FliH
MSEESVVYRRVTPEYDLVITCPSDLLEESVVYQDIFQKGFEQGFQQGVERGARKWVMRQLELRFGKPSRTIQRQIERLVVEQLEALCEAQIDFQTKDDLNRWLKQHAAAR